MKSSAKKIAIVTSDLQYFSASICTGLYHEFLKAGYNTEIFLTFEKEENEKTTVLQIIQRKDIVGLVIFSCLNSSVFYNDLLKNIKIPCVFADRLLPYLTQCNFVTVDNYGGAFKIGKLLVEKGAKSIACLSMLKDNRISTIEDRINGFRDSHANYRNINCFREELEYTDIFKSMEIVLSKWEKNKYTPDAVFATNHLIMNVLISLIQQNKLFETMMQNTLLSCFDNIPYFDWIQKPITRAEQPINEIIFYVSNILLRRIDNAESLSNCANIILPVKIIDGTAV